MKITKHSIGTHECVECGERAELVINIGFVVTHLCNNCAWDLQDMLDKTTSTSFASTETEKVKHRLNEHAKTKMVPKFYSS